MQVFYNYRIHFVILFNFYRLENSLSSIKEETRLKYDETSSKAYEAFMDENYYESAQFFK